MLILTVIVDALYNLGGLYVDLGLFFAILAPICTGPPEKRKRVAYDAIVCRLVNDCGTYIRKFDAIRYIKLLRAIYVPSQGSSEIMEVHGQTYGCTKLNFFIKLSKLLRNKLALREAVKISATYC